MNKRIAALVILGLVGLSACGPEEEVPVETTVETTTPATLVLPGQVVLGPATSITINQANASKSAASYLALFSFSRSGLIEQLSFEGFSVEDATYGVDNQGADWYAQAAKKAAEYLKLSAFSYQSLVDQLIYEGFTPEEAVHGVNTTGLS
jgi:hypothetical protein